MRQLSHRSRAKTTTAILFSFAAVFFFVALFATAVSRNRELIPGVVAFYTTFAESAWALLDYVGLSRRVFGEEAPIACVVGMFANLTLFASAAFGWSAHRGHAASMFFLSLNGVAAGLTVPLLLRYSPGYAQMYAGYWSWIASLALVAAGWGSVVWNQRQMRNTAIAGEAPR